MQLPHQLRCLQARQHSQWGGLLVLVPLSPAVHQCHAGHHQQHHQHHFQAHHRPWP